MAKFRNRGRLTDGQIGFILVIPALAIFITVIMYPFLNAIAMSFTDRSLLSPNYEVVGLENYIKVFSDPYFLKTVGTTILFVVLGLVIVIDGALSIRRALRLHTYYFPYWWVPLVISLVMCALGVGVMFRPFASAALLLRITGVVLVFQGIHDLWCVRQLAVLTRHVEKLSQQAHPEDEPPF